ncbi:phosphate-repressible phosphate permease [Fusarium beomiforme]|uniref:Phosphate-repressible phosphate permease n=1 Tax=Fusarium beomiforme TaxID=44412 RepID=A0A9P5DV60_9HYPO|nr:phosphate-repressible phosphate permease [Fusarium beomiforme]
MVLHQYDYIFAIGTIFSFLDAWNIGANDVANSWATSVSSRSISYIQAMTLGSILEFAGSVGVGARVADTIRTKVVDIDQFESDPALLMLGMMCAIVSSSLYLTFCTRIGLPVSTTHSIMGGVIGMGIALVGADGIHWAEFDKGISSGVVSVFLAWIIAPGLSGAFAAIIFLITKYGVMLRSKPVWKGLFLTPVYFGITASLLTMLIVWKGGSIKVTFNDAETAGMIIGVGAAWALLITIFLLPWLYRLVICDDWELRWWNIFQGPLLLRRPPPPAQPEGAAGGIKDFYEGHLTREELDGLRRAGRTNSDEFERAQDQTSNEGKEATTENKKASSEGTPDIEEPVVPKVPRSLVGPKPDGQWFSGAVLYWYLKKAFLSGVDQDIITMQKKKSMLTGDLDEIHAHVAHYDNRAEYLYTFMQVMTACTASFTHGANDVANAIGPYATIYQIWRTGGLEGSKSSVPVWILCFGGAGIALGIWTYGYNIMRNLGNRLTLHSPSRGFSMELGAAITIILATRLKLPVSTTQCITGATVGVGLCSGTWRSINWRMVAWIYMGWIITLPVAGVISGCICGIIINAPRWGYSVPWQHTPHASIEDFFLVFSSPSKHRPHNRAVGNSRWRRSSCSTSPDETVDAIFKLLPGRAIKAVRESCKRLNRIASPYHFPVLYISCHQLDLDVFRLVANNPLLIGGVHPSHRRDHLDLDEGETLNPRFANGSLSKVKPTKEDWELFNSIVQGHHENHLAHADFEALREALTRLKELQRLAISNSQANEYFSDRCAQSHHSSNPVAKMWRRFDSEREEYVPLPPRCDWHPTTAGLEDRSPVNTMDWLDERLIYDITPNGQPGPAINLFDQQSPFPGRLSGGFSAAGNITTIHLILSNFQDSTFGNSILHEGRVRCILASMPQLQDLYFEPHGMVISPAAISSEITFRLLRRVQFSCGHLHPQMFLDFLERHGRTLKSLTIKHCSLRPGDQNLRWPMVVGKISEYHDQGIMQLEDGDIDNVFQSSPVNGCGRNDSLRELGKIWKYEGEGKWQRWLNAVEEEANEMMLNWSWDP